MTHLIDETHDPERRSWVESANGYSCLLEISRGGAEAITMPTGEARSFLEDGDEVIFSATATALGFVPISFGPCQAILVRSP
jgi:fumarylacetoacetase